MNPDLKNHVDSRLEKVHKPTEDIFNDKFFSDRSIVANALDNIKARRYVDERCVTAKTPLIDGGTLGAKGHV